ncbi:MAG: wax ester/triacylglycerol synthase family O-acyltransferase [Microthrixaceae bacterium]
MPHERLTATDASFLYIESPHEPQHVGSLSILEGAPLRDSSGRIQIEEIRRITADRLAKVPRMRQRVRMVPFRQGRPVWVDDDRFDIQYHVRLTSLPRPGTPDQLLDLMSRLQSLPLDRSRPLWELWFVDGLADDNVAQVMKVHHCVGDGIANVDMAMALVDLEPHPEIGTCPQLWVPNPPPSDTQLLIEGLAEQLSRPVALARNATSAIRDPQRFLSMLRDVASTAVLFSDSPKPAPWNTSVSAHRRWVSATASMEQVSRIRRSASVDATLNDVVLAACTSALRGFMADRGEDVGDDRSLKAMVPVSRRGDEAEGGKTGNQVSLIVVDLPVSEFDPLRILEDLHGQTAELKDSGMADGAETIVGIAGAAPMLAPTLAKVVSRQIPMNLVITNVPGPPVPLWAYGARVLEAYPYVEVIDGEGLTIAVLSYEGTLHFGLTGDREQMHDLPKLADGIARAFGDLESAVC